MTKSLAYWVEEWALQLCTTHDVLKGLTMRHRNDDREAQSHSLVFEATEQEKALRAIQGLTSLELSIVYTAPAATPKQRIELIVAAISEAFQTAKNRLTAAQGKFTDLIIDDGGSEEQSNTDRLLKRTVKIPVIAKLR